MLPMLADKMDVMAYRELSKQINDELYPDVAAAGNLSNALAKAFAELGSPLQPASEVNFIPLALARTEGGSRFSQMYIAAYERLFLLDFWSRGVVYGNASTSSLNDAAQAIHFWIIEQPNIAQMQNRFTFFTADEQAKAHETGHAVEYQWERLLKQWARRDDEKPDAISPLPLIEAAMQRPELRQLFPFTSLYALHFSRTTGYPFTNDCPYAIPIGNARFRAHMGVRGVTDPDRTGDVIGEGDVDEVIGMLVANLPPNCGPAIEGTADLEERS